MSGGLTALASRRSRGCPGRGSDPGVLQVPVVVAVRGEDERGVLVLPLLVGLERAREGVELGIAVIGAAVHARGLGVSLPPDLLDLPVGGRAGLAPLPRPCS